MTVLSDIGALHAVAFEDFATDSVRDAGRTCGLSFTINWSAPRSLGSPKAFSFEVGEQEIYRALDDHTEIATRVRMAHEISAELEFSTKLVACREFDSKTRFRQRLDARLSMNSRRPVGSRKTCSEKHLDLSLALACNRREKFLVVFLGEPFAHELERREMHVSGREERKHDRKAPTETCSENTPECLAFAQPELPLAKVEHRRKAGDEVKPSLFDFSEMRDEPRRELAV